MKISWILCVAAFLCGQNIANGQTPTPLDLDFKVTKSKVDKAEKQVSKVAVTEEKWIYKVEVRNASNADAVNLTFDYRVFVKDDRGKGGTEGLISGSGSESITAIKKFESAAFETIPMKLAKSQLDSGYIYSDGSRSRQRDTLYGIWIKVMQDGQQVAEFIQPTSLPEKQKW